ncbi:hypothetical protein PHYSODRAFT_535089, partial [Phytophthora sojae]
MATSNKYAFFRPDTLDTAGYAYGKAISEAQRGKIEVERVARGRWADAGTLAIQREASELEMRAVTEEEALSGVGTYVGCALCIAR